MVRGRCLFNAGSLSRSISSPPVSLAAWEIPKGLASRTYGQHHLCEYESGSQLLGDLSLPEILCSGTEARRLAMAKPRAHLQTWLEAGVDEVARRHGCDERRKVRFWH